MHIAALILPLAALSTPALADGTAVWLQGSVDPTQVAGATHLSTQQAAPSIGWGADDDTAIANLRAEFDAVRPLLDVFDGELQVLRRLDVALETVQAMQADDRTLIHDARAFQGLAAWRYFQDSLATDPDAAPFRVELPDGSGGTVSANRAWVDAIAVDPDTLPSAEVMPDDEARLAYQQLRAHLLVVPDAAFVAVAVPAGGRLLVDGQASPSDRARVIPGEHRIVIEGPGDSHRGSATDTDTGQVLLRQRLRVNSGDQIELATPATATELAAFGDSLDGVSAVALPPRVAARLAGLASPVNLVVADGRRTVVYRVSDGAAVPMVEAGDKPRRVDDQGLSVRIALSQAWLYDGEFYLLHAADGAPPERATVNSAAPGLHAALGYRRGIFAASAGVDGRFSLGEWHYLDVGDSTPRVRLYPHVGAGLPWLQVTIGPDLPWRLGLGARAHLPVAGPLELTGGALWGLGLPVSRVEAQPDYGPGDSVTAWLGLGLRLGT